MLYTLPMAKSIFVTGGAASGKSVLAERLTLELGRPAIYIATAMPGDAEMAEKIAQHQARRGGEWSTIETPTDLPQALRASDGPSPRLVDCLTLWLTNMMMAEQDWEKAAKEVANLLPTLASPVVFVSNEVGSGIVPENALARRFRNAAGQMNQHIAGACDEVWMSVSGCPFRIKPT